MHPNLLRKDVEKIIEIVIYEMIEALCRDEVIEIRGWWRIKIVMRKARIVRNPKNSKIIHIKKMNINESVINKTSEYFKKKGIILPKISELTEPNTISEDIQNKLKSINKKPKTS